MKFLQVENNRKHKNIIPMVHLLDATPGAEVIAFAMTQEEVEVLKEAHPALQEVSWQTYTNVERRWALNDSIEVIHVPAVGVQP